MKDLSTKLNELGSRASKQMGLRDVWVTPAYHVTLRDDGQPLDVRALRAEIIAMETAIAEGKTTPFPASF